MQGLIRLGAYAALGLGQKSSCKDPDFMIGVPHYHGSNMAFKASAYGAVGEEESSYLVRIAQAQFSHMTAVSR